MQNIERLLIAPNYSRNHLIIKNGLDLTQTVIVCLLYIDCLINDKLPYSAAWIQCTWLFIFFIFNLTLAILCVLFIPQLITLKKLNNKRNQVIQLRLLLQYKLYTYLTVNDFILSALYAIGFVIMICDLIFGESKDEAQTIKSFVRYTVIVNILKYIVASMRLEKKLEQNIIEETQKNFIKIHNISAESSILKEECPICYEQFTKNDCVAAYLCQGKHKFHKECVVKWLGMPNNKKKQCPYCKQMPLQLQEYI